MKNNWNVLYTHIRFLEQALSQHDRVESFVRTDDILFEICRTSGASKIVAVLINRYTIGLADVISVLAEFPSAACVVAPGSWCGYTREAKDHGRSQGVGVFTVTEFLGALWLDNPVRYAVKDDEGNPIYAYRTS